MKIRVVTPIIIKSFGPLILQEFTAAAKSDVEVTNVFLDAGPASIESEYDDALAVPGILAKVRQAGEEGVDSIVINCMADPGLRAARDMRPPCTWQPCWAINSPCSLCWTASSSSLKIKPQRMG